MGSSSSRLGSRPSRLNRTMKRGFSSLICGSSSSHASVHQTDYYPAELSECSAQGHNSIILNEVQSSTKEETSTFSSVNESPRSTVDALSNSSNTSELSNEYRRRCFEISNDGKSLSESEELVQDVSGDGYSPLEPYSQRNAAMGSTSHTERQSPPPVCDAVEEMCSSSRSHQEPESSCPDRALPAEYLPNDVLGIRSSGMSSVPIVSDSSVLTSHPLRNDAAQEVNASGPGLLMLDSQRDRSGSVLHVDVVSISSGSLFSGTREVSNREARRNSRRLFWDAFSRRNSRRHSDSRTIFFSSEGTDDLGSQDRWLLDFSGDLFEDGIGSDSAYPGNRSHGMYEGRWHSRSEIWNRFRGGLDESTRQITFCASGLHPDGTCSCESFLTAEESGTRGSISRIVMLAEALFEVLDEIHRQPASFALSMVSVPAPESIVNSFPLKSHKRCNTAENGDDAEQCYICLAEYEEGDKIRVLPCHHEYHMACVDKWLKEIHGYPFPPLIFSVCRVCPLCRGDVCVGAAEGSITNSG